MATVALDRRFDECREQKPPGAGLRSSSDGALGWGDLLARHRVVILAEAGSGKTVELAEQARLLRGAGRYAFYATVQDVGREGLEGALSAADCARLATWRASNEAAWFFIDSVDEAKLNHVRFERAVRRLGDGIAGAERRAHIMLSGRHTDWEFRRDLGRLTEALPIPHDAGLSPLPTPDQMLISFIRHERRKEQTQAVEVPLIVVMASLDRERVRLFAEAKGVSNLDAFLAQIEASNLWRFARRPLDLDWLVQFWRGHNRLGTLSEMIESSLTERLNETNLDRARCDRLDAARALHAIERVGAALVFGRKDTIAIPDTEVTLSADNPPLDLAEVLPDWSAEDRMRLLTRPVFDPATFGRARLHNDNEGVVRGYLTARWLSRLRRANLSRERLFDLLLANNYGVKLIKPSMRETAAWLAILDEDVAREIARRDLPLLLTAGDPASLPADLRRSVLAGLVEQIASGDLRLPLLDGDSVKRFARPDIAEVVRELWCKYQGHSEARQFLLKLIWIGDLKGCADLAADAAFGLFSDRYTRIFAGRALVATGDKPTKQRYVQHVKADCTAMPNTVVSDAIDGLFPIFLTVDDLLAILAAVDITDNDGGLGFMWQGQNLVNRLNSRSDLERLLRGLLEQLGGDIRDRYVGYPPDQREEAYFPTIAAAASRLLEHCPEHDAPDLAIDAALRLGERRRHNGTIRKVADVGTELHRTAARRRLAFWRAAERLNCHRMLQRRVINSVSGMEFLGYSPGLRVEDLDWLLTDGPKREAENERRLTISAAMQIWRDAGSPEVLRERIEEAARTDSVMTEAYEGWMHPVSESAEQLESARQFEEIRHSSEVRQAECDQSWLDFLAQLKSNPEQLRQLRPPSAEGVDVRLLNIWKLLYATVNADTRYAIDSVASLEPMLGPEVTEAVRYALITYWRAWKPQLKSAREPTKRNEINSLDCMGITGVTLEAKADDRWADRLTSDEATLAASYATIEINGFPFWLSGLAAARPQEVRAVLIGEIAAELAEPEPRLRYDVLDSVCWTEGRVIELVAPGLLDELERRPGLPPVALLPMLRIISRGLREHHGRFTELAINRFNSEGDPGIAALYLGAAFGVSPAAAATTLSVKLNTLNAGEQTTLVERFLPLVFGNGISSPEFSPDTVPFDCLERLVGIAFRTIRVEEDHKRAGGVYTPDERDHAEHARNAAFDQLARTPGLATFNVLNRLAENPAHGINRSRLRDLARDRAAEDSESAPWPPAEARAFEHHHESAPSTAPDLQLVALRRLADMQHDLLHGDFAQGGTLSMLPDETEVQKWVADRLRHKQGRAYSIEREPHVAGEKEPDVRFRAKATDASVAMEIKVAESWTLPQLEGALTDQLCGRYLRARDGRYGILLLVHQETRTKGWEEEQPGVFLKFDQVVERLQGLAAKIAGGTPDGPQPEIAILDVSSCARGGGDPSV